MSKKTMYISILEAFNARLREDCNKLSKRVKRIVEADEKDGYELDDEMLDVSEASAGSIPLKVKPTDTSYDEAKDAIWSKELQKLFTDVYKRTVKLNMLPPIVQDWAENSEVNGVKGVWSSELDREPGTQAYIGGMILSADLDRFAKALAAMIAARGTPEVKDLVANYSIVFTAANNGEYIEAMLGEEVGDIYFVALATNEQYFNVDDPTTLTEIDPVEASGVADLDAQALKYFEEFPKMAKVLPESENADEDDGGEPVEEEEEEEEKEDTEDKEPKDVDEEADDKEDNEVKADESEDDDACKDKEKTDECDEKDMDDDQVNESIKKYARRLIKKSKLIK